MTERRGLLWRGRSRREREQTRERHFLPEIHCEFAGLLGYLSLPDIQRVAILDFDVHHGNGTEACVVNTIPSSRTFSYKTPFSKTTEA